ncbi:ENPP7 [Branchiostoma lanceolatum]|uniref:ENPP7 protein n=1 Tax=Branchiostoma lanceolatum TaxID=7740 RepID=A0A8K0ETT6_BRALA|nr:ENPP7 [Branchiostoma lanceolatum]
MATSRLAALPSPLFLITILTTSAAGGRSHGRLLLVILDGFRWDLDRLEDLPNLAAFSAEGVNVPYVTPTYVTMTVPSIFTIVTGLYPESHGVLYNFLFDKSTGQVMFPENAQNSTDVLNAGVEPIWVTASKQGRRTGTYMFETVPGMLPDVYVNVPFTRRNETIEEIYTGLGTALDWFSTENVDFTAFYIGTLDNASHVYGPESPAARASLKQIDGVIGQLLQQVKQRELTDLNIILTADHGFRQVLNVSNPIEIYKYVDPSSLTLLLADLGPLALIQPAPGRREEVYAALAGSHPNMTVYYKEDFPTRFHYANSPRMTDILAMADPGYVIYSRYPGRLISLGQHGYDNRDPAMKALFRAWGPNFRRGYVRSDPFDSVHIYPLMCEILGVDPAPNNGTLEEVSDMLVGVSSRGLQNSAETYVFLIAMIFTVMLM